MENIKNTTGTNNRILESAKKNLAQPTKRTIYWVWQDFLFDSKIPEKTNIKKENNIILKCILVCTQLLEFNMA